MKEFMDERKSGNTKMYIVLLCIALLIGLLWVTGLIRWEDSSEEQVKEGALAEIEFDRNKVETLINRYGKDNAGHDKGAVAVKLSELMSCKVGKYNYLKSLGLEEI